MVTTKVLGGVLTLTEGHVGWFRKNPCSSGTSPRAMRTNVIDSYYD